MYVNVRTCYFTRMCVCVCVFTCIAEQLGVAEAKEGAEGIIDMAAFLTANGMIHRTCHENSPFLFLGPSTLWSTKLSIFYFHFYFFLSCNIALCNTD